MGLFTATRYVASIEMIEIEWLRAQGIRCVLLDRDNTCVPRDAEVAPPAVLDWIERVHRAGISTCIVSNNFHSRQVERSARELGCDVVHHAMKPAPIAVTKALRKMGVTADEAILIGDQVYTDVVAGNLAGVRTVLVRPQSTADLWYTNIMRKGERMILGGRSFEGE
ncbi:MAG: YqeG family HAD IIIA-type phosphatase [Acidobacteriota bacterium]|nr:YqeG family HAD IIIA-type phosphatase [Acidobacteriota bacterium]